MSLRAVGRMIVAPAAVAAAAGILPRPLGPAASRFAFATFFAAQLAVLARRNGSSTPPSDDSLRTACAAGFAADLDG